MLISIHAQAHHLHPYFFVEVGFGVLLAVDFFGVGVVLHDVVVVFSVDDFLVDFGGVGVGVLQLVFGHQSPTHFDVVVLAGVDDVFVVLGQWYPWHFEVEEGGGVVVVEEGMLEEEMIGGPQGSVDSRFFAT